MITENTRLTLREARGPLLDLIEKLSSENGAAVLQQLKQTLRGSLPTQSASGIIVVDRPNLGYRQEVQPLGGTMRHPDLLRVGPVSYDGFKIRRRSPQDLNCRVPKDGIGIYNHLQNSDLLKYCLGYEDLEEICAKDIPTMESILGNHVASFWKAVARNSLGELVVPCLYPRRHTNGMPIIDWRLLTSPWIFPEFDCPMNQHILMFPRDE